MARPKGNKNKKTLEFVERAEALGVDPIDVMLLFAKGDWKALGYKAEMYVASEGKDSSSMKFTIDPAIRLKAASEACQYINAKKRHVEVTGKDGAPLETKASLDPETLERLEKLTQAILNDGKA